MKKRFLFISLLLVWPAFSQASRTIPFRVTSRMWDAASKQQIPTPPAIVDKIQKAFDLWSTVEEVGLQFRYDGLVDADYKGFLDVPKDGAIYIVLNNWDMGQCNDGISQPWGRIPEDYKGGACAINTKKGIHTVRVDILIHEIGHALGIRRHAESPSAIMSMADHPWVIQEYLTLGEQDRADLIRVWRPDFPGLYTISGRVDTSLTEQMKDENRRPSVFAVAADNGHSYSAKTDEDGSFTISLLRPGDYRVFSKPSEPYLYDTPATQSPSWYVSDGQSTNDPYGGRILQLGGGNRSIRNLTIKILDRPVAFNFFRAGVTYGKDAPFCFARPGVKTRLNIEGKGMTALEAYGTNPDYTLSDLTLEPDFKETMFASLSVRADAEPGERLVIAKGGPGEAIQAGLIGVNVVTEIPVRLSPGNVKDIEEQVRGKVKEDSMVSPSARLGRIITYKPGDPLPPELSPKPAPQPLSSEMKAPSPLFSGLVRSYYPNGFVRMESNYKEGRRLYLKEFDSSGRLLRADPPPEDK